MGWINYYLEVLQAQTAFAWTKSGKLWKIHRTFFEKKDQRKPNQVNLQKKNSFNFFSHTHFLWLYLKKQRFHLNFDLFQRLKKNLHQEIPNYKKICVPFIFHMPPWWPMFLFWGWVIPCWVIFLWIFGGGWIETKTGFQSLKFSRPTKQLPKLNGMPQIMTWGYGNMQDHWFV